MVRYKHNPFVHVIRLYIQRDTFLNSLKDYLLAGKTVFFGTASVRFVELYLIPLLKEMDMG